MDSSMDVRYKHGTDIHVVRACYEEAGADLLAIAGVDTVEILLITPTSSMHIASFNVGTRVTALTWSPRVASPTASRDWSIEVVAAAENYKLYLLTKSAEHEEHVFEFGGGINGHHGKINDMTFCGGRGEESMRYLATVSDDKTLMVWDLNPPTTGPKPTDSDDSLMEDIIIEFPQPTAYVMTFPHPLTSVNSHPTSSTELLVADCRGSIFIKDWRADPDASEQNPWHTSSTVELVEPYALASTVTGTSKRWSGSVSWRRDSFDIIGAAYGSGFALWDLSDLRGAKPSVSGTSFPEGNGQFRWSPTSPEYFAISSSSPAHGAAINVHHAGYTNASPVQFPLGPRPLYVRSFDFLACPGIPRIAAAVGRDLIIFYIGVLP
ncbi:hypothetical protein WOLCODRAFT_136435 [Wolfiporia cocos MD-104 SS10]|uniref:Uncharacterized protein n=1 Tax=Wolfiporia cocos (strain MD-104) TaxID=742152 RepID=A0A2H3J943_WOLCO|nr:hypothetical protein WOLCODRAFT_136435 [Wolfiporia cocos MD-104 SS10]